MCAGLSRAQMSCGAQCCLVSATKQSAGSCCSISPSLEAPALDTGHPTGMGNSGLIPLPLKDRSFIAVVSMSYRTLSGSL